MKSTVTICKEERLTILILNQGRANAINAEFLEMLSDQLAKINSDESLLITGSGDYFSAGLDLRFCDSLTRSAFQKFIEEFQRLLLSIIQWEGITAAYVNGHCVAGGFILASCADKTYFQQGKYHVGMNEEKLGFQLPVVPWAILKNTYTDKFHHIIGRSKFYSPEQLASITNITRCPGIDLKKIQKELKQISDIDLLRMEKENRQRAIQSDVKEYSEKLMRQFYDEWWSDKAVSIRRKIIRQMDKRRRPIDRN